MKIFCGTCNKIVVRPHGLGHVMLTYKQMAPNQKTSLAHQLGSRLAGMLDRDPMTIVTAFLSALEDADQHDFSRIVQKRWAALLKH